MKIDPPKPLNLDTSVKTLAISLCDEVDPSIYLGSYDAVTNAQLLSSLNIKNVLTIGVGMDKHTIDSEIKRLQISVLDEQNENLLQHFDQTNSFIASAISNNEKVLVHCMAGISRSATVVCAYLMKTYSLSSQEAIDKILKVRPIIDPNPGFREQLEIYEQVDYEVDVKKDAYRRFLIGKMSEDFISQGYSDEMVLGIDPEQMVTDASQIPFSIQKIRCKRCRRALIYPENIIKHEPGNGQSSFQYRRRNPSFAYKSHEGETCSSYFIEPMSWIEGIETGSIEGKIDCPKCNTKLGSYSWRGSQCSCGQWITPAFMVHKSKVDAMAPRSISFYQ